MAEQEPEVITWGRGNIGKYKKEEFRASLTRAFKDNAGGFVVLDSNMHNQQFLAACMAWAIDEGFAHNDRNQDDGQCKVSSFRLTEAGEAEFLKEKATT